MMRKCWLFWTCAVVALGACGADFPPYNRLAGLRVLAIQTAPASPGPGEATTLTPLIYTPGAEPDPTLTLAWSWCPFSGSPGAEYPCLITEEQAAMLPGAGGSIPPFDLGTAATARLEHTVSPELLAQLCRGVEGSPQLPDCEGGFPVLVKLRVRTSSDELVAVRTVRLRFDPATGANTNPTIEGLTAVVDGAEQPLADDRSLTPPSLTLPSLTLPRAADTTIRAQVGEAAAESYQGRKGDLTQGTVRETLTFTWFIESGETRDIYTKFIENDVPLERALENRWKPARPKDYPGETARLIVVVRDSRGGVGWRSASVRLAP